MASGGENVSLAELEQRLVTFSEQLQSIHELLQSDPENSEFLTIAQDLVEVIRLTKEMIDLKLNAAPAKSVVSASPQPPEDRKAESGASETEFSPGSICEALSKDVWFPAFIESLTARDTYNVHYLGFGNKDELPATSLRHVDRAEDAGKLPGREQIAVGFKCRAKYYVDGQYYTAQVTATTPHGFQVLFDGYGNSEEVPYEYMRPLDDVAVASVEGASSYVDVTNSQQQPTPLASTASSASAGIPPVKPRDAVIAKAIKVPENLQVLPTDSEAEKERKRKRLKHIQKLNKQIEEDNTHNLKQHDWKSFQHKAIKKGTVKGSGALSKRGSMFASPDSVQGRVGVVGSGQGMTQYDATRKKIKTSHLSSAPRL